MPLVNQDYGAPNLPEAMQQIMAPSTVVERAFEFLQRQKQQELRNKWNEGELEQQQAMNPLERMIKQAEADKARVRSEPAMLDAFRKGYLGENESMSAAGELAKANLPYKQKAQQAELQNEFRSQDALGQIQQLDDLIGTEQNPGTRAAYMKERMRLTEALKSTPKFAQQKELSDDKGATQLQIAELRAQHAKELAELKGSHEKALTTSQQDAHYRSRFARDPNDLEAARYLQKRLDDTLAGQAGMYGITLDPETKKLLTKLQMSGAGSKGSSTTTQSDSALIDKYLKK